jgi:hypothetical protein
LAYLRGPKVFSHSKAKQTGIGYFTWTYLSLENNVLQLPILHDTPPGIGYWAYACACAILAAMRVQQKIVRSSCQRPIYHGSNIQISQHPVTQP